MATRPSVPIPLAARRLTARAVRSTRRTTVSVRSTIAKTGFPYRKPSVPGGISVPKEPSKLGANFDTEWARSPVANAVRAVVTEGPLRMLVRGVATPSVYGADRLEDFKPRDDEDARPLIFTPNHHSHLDTPLSITSIPMPWRRKLVVAAAADYFFSSQLKGTAAALMLNALPLDREATGRKSMEQITNLIADGWSLVIYPEGGRSPDGWGQDFKGGPAYLSSKTGAPIVPMFIDGTGAIFGKGMKRPKPGKTKVVFGAPMTAAEGESTRRFNARIERAVSILGDESLTDFWTARQNAAKGSTPDPKGPEFQSWRRTWTLNEQRKRGTTGLRVRQKRLWPEL